MPIPFSCPHCGVYTPVAERYAGQSGPCNFCGKPVTAPTAAPAHVSTPEPEDRAAGMRTFLLVLFGGLAAGAVMITLGVSLLFPALSAARSTARRNNCAANLERLAQAMNAYHDDYGCFPPAYVADPSGKPMHSWRVLLLPYLEEKSLYKQYDFNQPWNSAYNRRLTTKMPEVFHCPDDSTTAGAGESNYFLLTGPGTMFPDDLCTSRKMLAAGDGLTHTLMIVETNPNGHTWLEPVDLDATKVNYDINVGDLSSYHSLGGINVATADGKSHFLHQATPAEKIHAMTTIDGGENVEFLGGF